MKKVLVVDDSETVRLQIARTLSDAGFETFEAIDGIDGLERIAEHAKLSLVILDVNMPRMNGLEMLERMRADPNNANTPVIMLTTEAEPLLIGRAKKAGAKAWIVKPVRMDQLVQTANKLAV